MQKSIINKTLFGLILTFCASLVQSQVVILSPPNNSVETLHHVAVTIVGKPGKEAKCYVNGELAQVGTVRIDGKCEFINVEVPDGPVEIKVEAKGARDRLFSATRKFHVIGPVDSLIPNKNLYELPADGRSTRQIRVDLKDAWNYDVTNVKLGRVRMPEGTIVTTDIDTSMLDHQIPAKDGQLDFTIQSSKKVGYHSVFVSVSGNEIEIPIRFTTPQEDFMVVGTAGIGLSLYHTDSDMNFSSFTQSDFKTGEFEVGNMLGYGQAALYAKGTLKEKYRVTASLDTRRRRENQLFRDLDPNEQYAVYGDASTITYDALTQSKFFGKIERNESFVIFGDFNTNMRNTEFTAYDRTFTGLLSQVTLKTHKVTAFATLNDRKMQLDEIRGEGISGYYFLSSSGITINSDKVRIETRDKYRPEIVLNSTEQSRFQHYDINYVDGTLMFKQPVPSIDANGNPVYIVVSYEYQSNKDKGLIAGLRYEGNLSEKVKIGSSFIVEEQSPKNYMLYGVDAFLPIFKWLTLKSEYAASRSSGLLTENETGQAHHTLLTLKPMKSLELNGYYREVGKDFLNQSQTGSQFDLGGKKAGVETNWEIGESGTWRTEHYRQQNQIGTVNENDVLVTRSAYEHKLSEKIHLKAGYEKAERSETGNDSIGVKRYNSNLIEAQVAYKWSNRLSSTLEHEHNIGSGPRTLPTATSVGVKFAATEKIGFFLKNRFLQTEGRKSQTIFGIDSKVTENTQMTGKYEIGGAAGEQLSRAIIGLNNQWSVRKDLTLNTAFESTATMDSLEVPTPEHQAFAVSFEYLPEEKPWKSSGKFELRKDRTMRQNVYGLGTEYKILDGLAMIARMEHMHAKYSGSGQDDDVWSKGNYQTGLAYRPELNDWFNSIAKVQLLLDKNTHVRPKSRLNRLIGSAHAYWQPKTWLEFGGRFAMRYLLDEEYESFKNSTLTTLYSLRTEVGWTMKWSTGFDVRLIHMTPVNQTKIGLSIDVGYVFMKNMQVGVGYMLKNLDDPDFSVAEYQFNNFYLLLRMKFSEDIFDWR